MKTIVGRVVELIAFLFSLFGGWLKLIAPPEADSGFAVGLASVLSLLLFLILSSVLRKNYSRAWVFLFAVAVALALVATASGFIYRSQLRQLTFTYPPGTVKADDIKKADYIAGTEYTEDKKKNYPNLDNAAELVAKYGGLANRDLVWTRKSQWRAATILTVWYVVFIVSVFGSVFCLTEGELAR